MAYQQTARSEAVRAASRDKLMKATLRLLARKGYDAMTMQEIVDEAGTSIGNAYFYFGNKDRLVAETMVAEIDALLLESERRAERLPPGPRRLAALLAANARGVTNPRRGLAKALVSVDQRLGTIQMTEDKATAVLERQLAVCFPDRRTEELPATAAAIFGVNRTIVQRHARGVLAMELDAALAFMIAWSLRALDVPAGEAEAIAREAVAEPAGMRQASAP